MSFGRWSHYSCVPNTEPWGTSWNHLNSMRMTLRVDAPKVQSSFDLFLLLLLWWTRLSRVQSAGYFTCACLRRISWNFNVSLTYFPCYLQYVSSSLIIIKEWEQPTTRPGGWDVPSQMFRWRLPPHPSSWWGITRTTGNLLCEITHTNGTTHTFLLQEIVQPHYNYPTGDKTKLHHDVGLCILRNYEKSLPLISFSVEGTLSCLLSSSDVLILIYINSKLLSDPEFEQFLFERHWAKRFFY